MNKTVTLFYCCIVSLIYSCKKQDVISDEFVSMRMYGFSVSDDRQIFRAGDLVHVVQSISKSKWEIRSINIQTLEQTQLNSIDIDLPLISAGVESSALIGTSKLIQTNYGAFIMAILYRKSNTLQTQLLRWNDQFVYQGASPTSEFSDHFSYKISSPALQLSNDKLTVVFGIAKLEKLDLKVVRYNLSDLRYHEGYTISIFGENHVNVQEGTHLHFAESTSHLIVSFNINSNQFIIAQRSMEGYENPTGLSSETLGINHLNELILWNDSIYASCDKTDFTGLVNIVSGNDLGVSNGFNPQLQFVHASEDQLIISQRSIPSDLSIADFTSIQFYNSNGNLVRTIQPEEIPLSNPRYIYAANESDGTNTLIGLTATNQAYAIKVDNNGKMISF